VLGSKLRVMASLTLIVWGGAAIPNRNISEEGSVDTSLIAFSERFKALESV
jgi:hypothetical protein